MTKWQTQPRTVLEYEIQQRAISYDEACAQFDEIAGQLGLDATLTSRHLRRFASGERSGARPKTQRVLEELFGQSAEVLFRPWDPETSLELANAEHAVTDFDAKSISQEELLSMTVRRARQFSLTTGQYVASEAIEQLHDDVREIAIWYPQKPLTSVLGDLVETQDTLFTLLDRRHRPTESKQLYMLAGVVGGILAKASHDMGDAHSAMTHARTSFMCADHADNDGLRAWIKGLQSFIAHWSKRPHEALRYASEGAEYAKLSGNTTTVWLAANEARAWATLGNSAQTQAAIERSEAAAEVVQLDDVDMFGGICTFGRSRQLYYAADALAMLPDRAAQAEDYSQQALTAYSDTSAPDWSFSDQAGSAADLAIARIAMGETDGALEAINPVLELDPSRRIHGIISSAQRVHTALGRAPESQLVTDLQMEIETFTRTPLTSLQP